ncbi:MAG: pilus assembly protein [Anaerolineae bacterium]
MNEKGQGIVEFAIVLAIVLVFVILLLALAGPAIGNIYANTMYYG